MEHAPALWIGFNTLILGLLALDLGVFQRHAHTPTTRESAGWTAFWVGCALLFNGVIFFAYGAQSALEFLAAYLLEKSLSLDNIFVIAMIFSAFEVPLPYQHRVLFWGILGALVMRATMIILGVALIERFQWMTLAAGFFLLYSGGHTLYQALRPQAPGAAENGMARWWIRLEKWLPVTQTRHGSDLWVRVQGHWKMTPLFVALLAIESADLIFAIDSIPAVLAVSRDTFIVYTSNIFAILGLRSLYFLLAGVLTRFVYLKHAMGIILGFVGIKMLCAPLFHVPVGVSLVVIGGTLGGAVALSMWPPRADA